MIGGVERGLWWWITLSSILASGIAWFAGVWYLAVPIFVGAGALIEFFRRATAEDPMASRVWVRWVFEPVYVAAVGRFDRRKRRGRL
jgi:hypothetical protein